MKYCNKCKMLCNDSHEKCPKCNKPTVPVKDRTAPVALCNVNAATREMLCAMLTNNNVPNSYNNCGENAGMGFESFTVYVPYNFFEKAKDICVGMGIETVADSYGIEFSDNLPQDETTEYQQMSKAKRTTVKVISAILFILVMCLVIWGVDYLMEIIKQLFM